MSKHASHQINPEKLLLSKWTAVKPVNKEKHFLVSRLIRDEQEIIVACVLEALINHREVEIDWHALKDASTWLPGWL